MAQDKTSTYDVKTPEGGSFTIQGPPGASAEQLRSVVQQYMQRQTSPVTGGPPVVEERFNVFSQKRRPRQGELYEQVSDIPERFRYTGRSAIGEHLAPQPPIVSEAPQPSQQPAYEAPGMLLSSGQQVRRPPVVSEAPPEARPFIESGPALLGGMVGGWQGGIAGAQMGLPLGPWGVVTGGALGALTGAGVGAGVGEFGRQSWEALAGGEGTEAIDLPRAAEEINLNIMGEAFGRSLGPPVGAAARYISPRFAQGAKSIIEFARDKGIPIDRATQTGSRVWALMRTIVDKVPFVGGQGQRFRAAQREALEKAFGDIAEVQTGTGESVITGQDLQKILTQAVDEDAATVASRLAARLEAAEGIGLRVSEEQTATLLDTAKMTQAEVYKSRARAAYAELDKIIDESEPVELITGTRTTTDPFNPAPFATRTEDIVQSVQSPVDLTAVKTELMPLFRELQALTDTATPTPGYLALKRFMEMDDIIPLSQAIPELSAIQSLARSNFPEMRNISQGVTARVVPPFRAAIDEAASKLGLEAREHLETGRRWTRERYDLFDTDIARDVANAARRGSAGSLINNPVKLRSILEQTNGEAGPVLAKNLTDDLIRVSTNKEGVFDALGFKKRWNKISDDVKGMLFSEADITAMNRLGDPIKSGLADEILDLAKLREPQKIVDQLLLNDDQAIRQLRAVNEIAPGQMRNIGRSFLQGILNKVEGASFSASSYSQWRRLGDHTRKLLFSEQQIKDMESFFELIRAIGADPSASGTVASLVGLSASGIYIATQTLAGDPEGAVVTAKRVGGIALTGAVLSALLYTRRGSQLLRTGLMMNRADPAARNTVRLLSIEIARAEREANGDLRNLPNNVQ
jgi:hypothetical protein